MSSSCLNLLASYQFTTSLSTGSIVVKCIQSYAMTISNAQRNPKSTHRIEIFISSRVGTTNTECRVSWIMKIKRVPICQQAGGRVQAFIFVQGPLFFLRGTNSFLKHSLEHINIVITLEGNCRLYYIMNIDKDSVVNFLTPTKLVHGTFKPRPRNLNDSHNHSTNKQKNQIPSDSNPHLFNYQQERIQNQFERNRDYSDQFSQGEGRNKGKQLGDKNYILNGTSKTVLRSQDNFKLLVDEKPLEPLVAPPKSLFQLHQVLQYNPPVTQVLAKVNNSQKNSRVSQIKPQQIQKNVEMKDSRSIREKQKEQYPPFNTQNKNMRQWQGSQDLSHLMDTLKGVRESIDKSISQLQQILDHTARYRADINQQFARIKQRILDYTSQVLDASFTRYIQNMVNWMKYEQTQKKALAILSQLDKTIKEDDLIVKQMKKSSKTSRVALGKQQQLQQKIQFYGNFISELQTAGQQCLDMRPQLRKQKIFNFQQALNQLTDF